MNATKHKFDHLKLKCFPDSYKYVLFQNSTEFERVLAQNVEHSSELPWASFITSEERSMMMPSKWESARGIEEGNWCCFRIIGEMPFGTVQGLIAEISSELIRHGVGVCVVSTFKTDLFFMREHNKELGLKALSEHGWSFA